MAIKIRTEAAPTIVVEFDLIGPGGDVLGPVRLECRAMRRSEFNEKVAGSAHEFMRAIIQRWDGFDEPYSGPSLDELVERVPAACAQMLREYTRQLFAVERKN